MTRRALDVKLERMKKTMIKFSNLVIMLIIVIILMLTLSFRHASANNPSFEESIGEFYDHP